MAREGLRSSTGASCPLCLQPEDSREPRERGPGAWLAFSASASGQGHVRSSRASFNTVTTLQMLGPLTSKHLSWALSQKGCSVRGTGIRPSPLLPFKSCPAFPHRPGWGRAAQGPLLLFGSFPSAT